MMTREQYLKEVSGALRRSGMPRKTRKRLETDLASDFSARLERGESAGEIIRAMGAPEALAGEFLSENSRGAPVRTPSEKLLLALGILFSALTAAAGLRLTAFSGPASRIRMWLNGSEAAAKGQTIIGGADGPTAIFVTSRPGPLAYGLFVLFLAACISCFILYSRSRRNRK
ncbi:hypothetical protein EQM14_15525 [Caproiciproducens sp. NJN-50]|uniref:HAAS signaling domain-containing protein n=1 Tax=Acutalibacteraceae TaxID=3082771 RepID=UPI000FFE2AE2|nr:MULTISPECIES: hypothetical protein [Acutalibacteraceae]QAT51064.1 hypothetical protein EQM14_15525 [Caproiciproducens sp. NJN-50]